MVAYVNPHLAIDPSDEQVGLENRILEAMRKTQEDSPSDRISLELQLQTRWKQIPTDVMVQHLEHLFEPFGMTRKTGLVILNESFKRISCPELHEDPSGMACRSLGQYALVFRTRSEPRAAGGRRARSSTEEAKLQRAWRNRRRRRSSGKRRSHQVTTRAMVCGYHQAASLTKVLDRNKVADLIQRTIDLETARCEKDALLAIGQIASCLVKLGDVVANACETKGDVKIAGEILTAQDALIDECRKMGIQC